ncbi:MAG TPA: BON domain-containing protein, partial [Steroidobacteraceae bacterium]|nr:BON domain-containing protein [Steroidobacteraceae bacterium]
SGDNFRESQRRESGAQDYDMRDEDFERRGWRPGSDYYGNDQERYAGGGHGGEQDDWRATRSAKAQGGYGGTRDENFGGGDFRGGQSYNDRWQDSYGGRSRGAAQERSRQGETGGNYGDRYGNRDQSGSRGFEGRSEGQFRGRGPRGYRRSDERIREDACECLTQDDRIDASNIEVTVKDCEVILSGSVNSRDEKRRAEELIERLSGVQDVNNSLRVIRQDGARAQS